VAGVLAFLLRFDLSLPSQYWPYVPAGLCVWIPVKVIVFRSLGLDRGWWRYASIRDVVRLAAANFIASGFACLIIWWTAPRGFPRSVYFLDFLLGLGMTAGIRMAVRLAFEFSHLPNMSARKRTLIYGAGDAGVALLREIQQNPALSYEIIGFIDDAPAKVGNFIHRVRVLGNGAVLSHIVASQNIETVLIAMPSAKRHGNDGYPQALPRSRRFLQNRPRSCGSYRNPLLQRMARREGPLLAYPPPGATEVVAQYQ
jgi:FlaA1/EpsC-like NDP-sugar epimerase